MKVKDLLEFTYFNILLEEIEEEYKKKNYTSSANLSNKLLEKLSTYTNMDSEIKEAFIYKGLSDEMIIRGLEIEDVSVVSV